MVTENIYKKISPWLAAFFVAITWASAFVGIRYVVSYIPPGELAFSRFFIASLTMFILLLIFPPKCKLSPLFKPKNFSLIFLCSLCGVSAYNVLLNYGETTVNAGLASFIVSQTPVVAILISVNFLKERLSYFNILGFIISTIGLFVIFFGSNAQENSNFWGIIFILLATLLNGFFATIQKPLFKELSPLLVISVVIWLGTLCLVGYAPAFFAHLTEIPFKVILTIIYLGVFPAGLAYFCWSYALSKLEVRKVSPILYTIPIISSICSIIFLSEWPTFLTIFGGIITLIGAYIVCKK